MHRTRVLYLLFANPGAYPPVVHGAHLLAESGAEVWIVGTRPIVSGAIHMATHPRIRLTLVAESRGVAQKMAFLRFVLTALWTATRFQPQWIYVSDLFGAPAGLVTAALARSEVVYHEHDVHSEQRPSVFVRLCMAARRRLAGKARCVIAPSPGRAQHIRDTLGVKLIHVVFNCPRRQDVRTNTSASSGPLRLVYQGTIVAQRLPLALVDALAALSGTATLAIAGYEPAGAEGHTQALIRRAAEQGASGVIVDAGLFVERDKLLDFCAGFDVGLALVPLTAGDVNMRTMAGASNKAFDYLACGLPLLVANLDDWNRLFVEPGYASAVDPDDTVALAEALRWMSRNRDTARAMGAAGRQRILAEWNYEAQFEPIRTFLLGGAHGPPGAPRKGVP